MQKYTMSKIRECNNFRLSRFKKINLSQDPSLKGYLVVLKYFVYNHVILEIM